MTLALAFRDSHALQVVLRSGLCPAEVLGGAARVARAGDGRLVLAPDRPLPEATLGALGALGVAVDAELPRDAGAGAVRAVRCWAEALAVERVAAPQIPSLLLLVTARAADLIDLAAELVRLGCDRLELVVAGERGAIRAVDAPTYTALRALDRDRALRGFAPDPAGQAAVWSELGYRHPLAGLLRAEPGTLLLLGGDGWSTLPDAGWRGLDAVLELAVPATRAAFVPAAPLPPRRTIELRLASGRREPPSLWVMRRGGVAAIDRLLAYLPDDVVERLAFAVTAGDAPIAIVRARAGRHAPPELALDAEAYAPIADLPDVYAPAGAIVEPPLRRERLRAILTGEPASEPAVIWLAALADQRFRVERIADTAFLPLATWADYVLHASAPALVPWMRATAFDFAPFVATGLAWASGLSEGDVASDDAAAPRARPPRARARPAVDEAPRPVRIASEPAPARLPAIPAAAAELPIDVELAALEAAFVALDAPGDAPERIALLDRLATAYARLGRRREAGLCFARAVWDAPAPEEPQRLAAWLASDGGFTVTGAAAGAVTGAATGADPGAVTEAATGAVTAAAAGAAFHALEELLALQAPDPDDVRAVAVAAALAGRAPGGPRAIDVLPGVARDPHRVQRWLDEHDGVLDARTLWLSRLGLARLAGGDPLGLAHARDRILARLVAGLPAAHELPAFLRFAGRRGAFGNASAEHLGAALEELAQRIARTRRKRSPLEAPLGYTAAYASMILAVGFARIGQNARARELTGEAQLGLSEVAADPVHGYLAAAFAARVAQAESGAAPELPLPEPVGGALRGRLAALDRVARYKVDRLREASRILEPIGRPDAVGGFIARHAERSPELAALRAIAEPRARAAAASRLVDAAATSEPERERLLEGLLEVLLELPEGAALPILGRAVPLIGQLPPSRRALRYAGALVVAGHFGRGELIPELLALLAAAIRVAAGPDLERVLHHSLRGLRRIGLGDEVAALLAGAEHALRAGRGDAIDGLEGRLALAAGLAFLGDTAGALPIFAEARDAVADEFRALGEARRDRPPRGVMRTLELTRALALAYGNAPIGHATAGIAELAEHLRDVTDTFGTNSHFCLSVLHFVESLVLGLTSDDLALGDAGRRFLEDDEHLLRRRLHRDLGGAS